MIANTSVLMIPALGLGGTLHILAGYRWLRGRWLVAVTLNAMALGTVTVSGAMHELAVDAAYRAMDARDKELNESARARAEAETS